MNTITRNMSEAYKAQAHSWKNVEPDFSDENDMKEKANELVRLNEAMHEKIKTASYLDQHHFLMRNSTNMKMMRNLITVSRTLRIEQH